MCDLMVTRASGTPPPACPHGWVGELDVECAASVRMSFFFLFSVIRMRRHPPLSRRGLVWDVCGVTPPGQLGSSSLTNFPAGPRAAGSGLGGLV